MNRQKKIWREIHGIIGLLVGIVIIIVAISGCVYTFQREIRAALYPDLLYVNVPAYATRLSIDRISQIAEQYHSETKVREIVVNQQVDRSVKVYMYGQHLLYINPYSGEVLGKTDTKKDPFLMAWSLHTQLGLGKVGGQIVGWATLACIPLIISGLWLWWPSVRTTWRRVFRLSYRGNWKMLNFQWHKNGGFYTSFFLLFICLSGLMMSFSWFEQGVYWLTGSEQATRHLPKAIASAQEEEIIEKSLHYTMGQFPDVREVNIFFPGKSSKVFMFIAKYEDKLGRREILYFNPSDGKLLEGVYSDRRSVGDKIKGMNYNIHSGQIWGMFGRIIAFIVTLFSVFLVISGALIWYQRKFR
ncbi:PepSY-associated TM helix domain-containing protein [Sphingobacterium yanglingense]|uniref:Putative iron-regulated membrane protein n=1 Tax=Sphingobacterium yanglingense TaxID=1437280 RepID=A0A4R6WAA6_9SPHI|nr:PepSY-associated TM helix domain-containing protein [Sphingobacterium yanglingense]TDQ76299.1 putative iron-regulated membrane protein [Sphingobacterium yanglingense]